MVAYRNHGAKRVGFRDLLIQWIWGLGLGLNLALGFGFKVFDFGSGSVFWF